ncbi:hypothetical protein CC85DRAFT_244511 [Cutaneotrichosporon oleaginosum]|uniref:DBF4-type domain-containing protein n=1 Tax=Cutaneotrichosporon oleaginosum TaxID=879819 RepID=A0A0J0XQ95_9TREE|nr:uncharacterized protein CC85DRAFT_244511 [Cutaneotrichosporon oleaginosum]KLT43247.1 hypothetical protein CC85DRAFT_244511 [Cutaneotrichosporon oleaginosum]TXT09926.1 hypothetical protein COLE_03860 [Cutaneotrichosporon oleaginosum]
MKGLEKEQEAWVAKWQQAFPNLTFHFELGTEEGLGRKMRPRVLKLGARVDQFFSRRITHLIVKSEQSPQKPRVAAMKRGQSDNPFLQASPTDLRSKAEEYGIKVWTVKKLLEMIDRLDPVNVVQRESLSHMLADEKLHGTRERDESAPRPDHYYFRPGSKYVLIEDATGKHRTIMVKEYSAKEQDWPVLHDQFLRLTTSCALPRSIKSVDHLHRDLRARAMALYVNHEPYNGEEPPTRSLKRSASDRQFTVPALPEPDQLPYCKASGNSVVLTSNIASTSTNPQHPTPGGVLAQPQNGGRRGAMQVSKRVEVLKRNLPAARGGAVKRSDAAARQSLLGRRKSAADLPPSFSSKQFLSQAEVVKMLQGIRKPTNLPKPTFEERLANRELVDAGQKRKEQDTASGYCENCRIRYTDLSVHMASRKHRRFALNEANFAELDKMLHCLQRPPNPMICVPSRVCRPCTERHTQADECSRCMDDTELSEDGSSESDFSIRDGMIHWYPSPWVGLSKQVGDDATAECESEGEEDSHSAATCTQHEHSSQGWVEEEDVEMTEGEGEDGGEDDVRGPTTSSQLVREEDDESTVSEFNGEGAEVVGH